MGRRPNLTDDNNCLLCKCNWKKHTNDNYHYVKVDEMEERTVPELKQKYDIASTERLLHKLKDEIRSIELKIDADHQRLQDTNENLKSIALMPNTGRDLDYIETLIGVEENKGNVHHAQVLRRLKDREINKREIISNLR